MKVVERGLLKGDVKIQIENWKEEYPNIYKEENTTLVVYPKSKVSLKSLWAGYYPRENEPFRFEMSFKSEKECKDAFNSLTNNEKKLIDYMDNYCGTIKKDVVVKCI
ncbi:hypothetical protein [Clostridium sp.]|uniref:hypothetical protein n=1 Tax=Clostridium sp. TaxID=1506 RepID=UPI001DEAB038|nr:hypothetical protein [Clostridium sp.]MBS5307728.1 hypothetical protein [Clostridium sp.]